MSDSTLNDLIEELSRALEHSAEKPVRLLVDEEVISLLFHGSGALLQKMGAPEPLDAEAFYLYSRGEGVNISLEALISTLKLFQKDDGERAVMLCANERIYHFEQTATVDDLRKSGLGEHTEDALYLVGSPAEGE